MPKSVDRGEKELVSTPKSTKSFSTRQATDATEVATEVATATTAILAVV